MNSFAEEHHRNIDFDALEYTKAPAQSLFCPVCKNVLLDPLQVSCAHAHILCTRCITRALEDKLECPVDRAPMPKGLEECTRANPLIQQVIDEMEVRCPNPECKRVLQRGVLAWHLKDECQFQKVTCIANCGSLVPRHSFTEGCSHEIIHCEHCGLELMQGQLLEHLDTCPELSHECRHCKEEFSAEDMALHECGERPAHCAAQLYGCLWTGTMKETESHQKCCILKSLQPYLQEQNSRLMNFELENRALKSIVTNLESRTTEEATIEVSSEYERDRTYIYQTLETLSINLEAISSSLAALDTKQSHLIMGESLRTKEELGMMRAAVQGLRMQWHHFLQNTRGPASMPVASSSSQSAQSSTNPPPRSTPTRQPSDGSRVKL